MNWITLEEIILVHERVIAETGGLRGMVNPGGLESALIRPFTAFGGYELFVDLHSKVAVLIDSIIAFHPYFISFFNSSTEIILPSFTASCPFLILSKT